MGTLLKLVGTLVLLTVVVAGAWLVQVWYFKPYDINIFFEKIFIQFALKEPELLTQLRILEGFGMHGHNAKLTDATPRHQEEMAAWGRDNLATLHRYDRADLKPSQQLSYDVLEWFLQDGADGERWMYHDYPVNQLTGAQSDVPDLLTTTQQINDAVDADDYVSRLKAFGLKFDQVLESLKLRESKGVLPPRFVVDKTLAQMRGFIGMAPTQNVLYTNLQGKLDAIKDLGTPQREQLLKEAEEAIDKTVYPAYQRLIAYFESLEGKVTENYGVWKLPDGDQYYAYMVRHHTTANLTPEQVHQIGLAEVARIEQEMEEILKSQGMAEGSIGSRVRLLNSDPRFMYPNTDEGRKQVLADYQTIIDEVNAGLDPYFNKRPKVSVEVQRVPEFKEKTAPGAYYQSPPLDASRKGVFFANLHDLGDTQKFGMRTLSYHEAIPGHHFQIALAQEMTGVPIFRKVLPFTAYVEGWALYAERLGWELGFEKDPFDNLGRLQAEMHRAVRLVVDSGLHYKRWTREQAIEYMVEKTGMADGDVVTEIERYMVWPGQALAYKIGMLKFLELRERAKQAFGDKFDIRQFHDVVLGSGPLPLGVLEQQVDRWIAANKT
jgi:uncharacterized protein (DUF885 family)